MHLNVSYSEPLLYECRDQAFKFSLPLEFGTIVLFSCCLCLSVLSVSCFIQEVQRWIFAGFVTLQILKAPFIQTIFNIIIYGFAGCIYLGDHPTRFSTSSLPLYFCWLLHLTSVQDSGLASESYQLKARLDRNVAGKHLLRFFAELPAQIASSDASQTQVLYRLFDFI